MTLISLNPPATEPVTLDYVKTFLRINTNVPNPTIDARIKILIKSARAQVEKITGRTLIRRTYVYRGAIPAQNTITLPVPPLLSVARITLVAENDTAKDIPPQDYVVSAAKWINEKTGLIALDKSLTWADYCPEFTTIEIEFDAGYGDAADDVPLPLRQAMLLLIAQAYEYNHVHTLSRPAPIMVDALCAHYCQKQGRCQTS